LPCKAGFHPRKPSRRSFHRLEFIVNQLEGLDPLIADIDERHAQYLRTSLRQIRYQLGSADSNFKDRLVSLAGHLSALRQEGMIELPEDSPPLRQFPVKVPDAEIALRTDQTAIQKIGSTQFLFPIKSLLPDEITYEMIRCVVAALTHSTSIANYREASPLTPLPYSCSALNLDWTKTPSNY